jgi:membrane-associated phospholipid phosphatase
MQQLVRLIVIAALTCVGAAAQRPNPGDWKTWFLPSGSAHEVPAPPNSTATAGELSWLRAASAETDPRIVEQIRYWNAGPPSLRWMDLMASRMINGQPMGSPFRAFTYVPLAMYDVTIAVENAKRKYQRARPGGGGIQPRVTIPSSSSYPSDYAATAFAAAYVLAYLYPPDARYFQQLAEEAGKSRLYAGVEYPSDYEAGMELGRRVAEQVIAKARLDNSDAVWNGEIPKGKCMWTGINPANVTGSQWKPLLLSTASEFRPPPPPDCESPQVISELASVRTFSRQLNTPNIFTNARALYWQTQEGVYPWIFMQLGRWMLEDKMDADPAAAARAYALVGVAGWDSYIASQDAKFAYWYLRPGQLDTSIVPLFPAPNFPGYPSNHSTFSWARAEVAAYVFPHRAEAIRALAKEAGDSRIWAGIHFEMDNQAGDRLGRDVARKVIAWAETDGSK